MRLNVKKRSNTISVKLDEDIVGIIDRLVYENRSTRSEVIRYIINEWMVRNGYLSEDEILPKPKGGRR